MKKYEINIDNKYLECIQQKITDAINKKNYIKACETHAWNYEYEGTENQFINFYVCKHFNFKENCECMLDIEKRCCYNFIEEKDTIRKTGIFKKKTVTESAIQQCKYAKREVNYAIYDYVDEWI